ncbi:hypothetical protein GCM10007094_25710 [Pseudovibrio japonicus]|uniref:GST N-terminal domain-containing protein n=1 Tax=Pseudovibrio japonicus TaxID=366534 RepID=A0ABQ3EHJ6_9HYPH|nr:hypothetical protein GCM10007094_25710 [Pseudovibrio japonicus]
MEVFNYSGLETNNTIFDRLAMHFELLDVDREMPSTTPNQGYSSTGLKIISGLAPIVSDNGQRMAIRRFVEKEFSRSPNDSFNLLPEKLKDRFQAATVADIKQIKAISDPRLRVCF